MCEVVGADGPSVHHLFGLLGLSSRDLRFFPTFPKHLLPSIEGIRIETNVSADQSSVLFVTIVPIQPN